jgi:hypothetical protein
MPLWRRRPDSDRFAAIRAAARILVSMMLVALAGAGAPAAARAQGSPTVAPLDPAYLDARRLIDAGLVRDVVVGQAPYSRLTFARLTLEAQSRMLASRNASASNAVLHLAIDRLLARFGDEVEALRTGARAESVVHALSEWEVDLLHTDAPSRTIAGNGLGSVEADIRPLTDNRGGRRVATGTDASLETMHWARLGSRLTLEARPRLWWHDAHDGTRAVDLKMLSANARLVAGNVALTVGREYTDWGTAPGGGLFFSANPPALDMIRIASETPMRLGGPLRWLGPVSGTLQLADVGASVSHSHSLLAAYKVSVQPTPDLELGATFADHFGGAGAVNPSLGRRLADLLPFIDIFRHHADSTEFDSDKLLGVDARLILPHAADVTVFGEFALEDFDVHRLKSVLTEDAALIVGVRVPTLLVPSVSAQLAYHATGLRFYEHHQLVNGIAASRSIIGDDLGRDASGWYGTVTWERRDGLSLRADAAYESRGNDQYVGEYTKPGLQGLVFRTVSTSPPELRRRVMGELAMRPVNGRTRASLAGGVERVSGPPLVSAGGRTSGLAEARFTVYR